MPATTWLDKLLGHIIRNASGSDLTQQPYLKFTGSGLTSIVDDPDNEQTVITLTGGTPVVPTGTGLRHVSAGVEDGAAFIGTSAQILMTSGSDTVWKTVSGDGSISSTGVLTIAKVNGIAISGTPAVGNQPIASSTSAAAWGALNLAGGVGYVSGVLGVSNGGTGVATATAFTVFRANGAGTPGFGAIDLSQSAAVTNQLPGANVVPAFGAQAVSGTGFDINSAGTLAIGTSTATAITIGKSGITTTNAGALTVSQLLTAATSDAPGTMSIGETTQTQINMGRLGIGFTLTSGVTIFNNNQYMYYITPSMFLQLTSAVVPSNPSSGVYRMILDSADGKLKILGSGGTLTIIGAP